MKRCGKSPDRNKRFGHSLTVVGNMKTLWAARSILPGFCVIVFSLLMILKFCISPSAASQRFAARLLREAGIARAARSLSAQSSKPADSCGKFLCRPDHNVRSCIAAMLPDEPRDHCGRLNGVAGCDPCDSSVGCLKVRCRNHSNLLLIGSEVTALHRSPLRGFCENRLSIFWRVLSFDRH